LFVGTLFDLLNPCPNPPTDQLLPIIAADGNGTREPIEFRNVSFTHPQTEPALRNVSFNTIALLPRWWDGNANQADPDVTARS